jgi:hypothetical protein
MAVNSPMLMKVGWGIVYGWLDEFVQQKIVICGNKSVSKHCLEYIDETELEEQYGGKKPRI